MVQYEPKARKVAPAPSEVPVVHSSSYLLKEKEETFKAGRRKPDDDAPAEPNSDIHTTSNAVDWALRRADAYFDEVEANSSEHSAARMLVKNPATRATMKTMQVHIYQMEIYTIPDAVANQLCLPIACGLSFGFLCHNQLILIKSRRAMMAMMHRKRHQLTQELRGGVSGV